MHQGLRCWHALLPILAGLLSVTGCMEVEHDLRLAADGSGVYELKYSIAETAVAQFRAIDALTRDLAEAQAETTFMPPLHPILRAMLDPREEDIRTALKDCRAPGLTIKHLKVGVRNAWRQVELTLAFEDLKKLEDTEFFRVHGFELRREADGGYVFWRRPRIDAQGATPPALDPASAEQLTAIMAGFKTSIRITVPGRILSSSALRSSLYTAAWTFDYDANPNALIALQRQPFRIAFEASNANLPEVSYAGPAAQLPAE